MDFIAPQKPVQPQISVSDLLSLPGCARVIGKRKWSKEMKMGVASAWRNRRFIDLNGATSLQEKHFSEMHSKIRTLTKSDKEVGLRSVSTL